MSERISKISDGRTPQFYVFYLLLCLALFALFAFIAARLGTDGTPDFKIYHFYNGYAFHVDRTGLDIFAAQMQTGFFPGLDAIYYSLFRALNDTPRLLNVVLSLPYGAAASVLFLIARLLISTRN